MRGLLLFSLLLCLLPALALAQYCPVEKIPTNTELSVSRNIGSGVTEATSTLTYIDRVNKRSGPLALEPMFFQECPIGNFTSPSCPPYSHPCIISPSTDVWNCPTGCCMSVLSKLTDSEGKATVLFPLMENTTVVAIYPGGDAYLPSNSTANYLSPPLFPGLTITTCFSIFFILGLLMMSMAAMGRSPLAGFDFSAIHAPRARQRGPSAYMLGGSHIYHAVKDKVTKKGKGEAEEGDKKDDKGGKSDQAPAQKAGEAQAQKETPKQAGKEPSKGDEKAPGKVNTVTMSAPGGQTPQSQKADAKDDRKSGVIEPIKPSDSKASDKGKEEPGRRPIKLLEKKKRTGSILGWALFGAFNPLTWVAKDVAKVVGKTVGKGYLKASDFLLRTISFGTVGITGGKYVRLVPGTVNIAKWVGNSVVAANKKAGGVPSGILSALWTALKIVAGKERKTHFLGIKIFGLPFGLGFGGQPQDYSGYGIWDPTGYSKRMAEAMRSNDALALFKSIKLSTGQDIDDAITAYEAKKKAINEIGLFKVTETGKIELTEQGKERAKLLEKLNLGSFKDGAWNPSKNANPVLLGLISGEPVDSQKLTSLDGKTRKELEQAGIIAFDKDSGKWNITSEGSKSIISAINSMDAVAQLSRGNSNFGTGFAALGFDRLQDMATLDGRNAYMDENGVMFRYSGGGFGIPIHGTYRRTDDGDIIIEKPAANPVLNAIFFGLTIFGPRGILPQSISVMRFGKIEQIGMLRSYNFEVDYGTEAAQAERVKTKQEDTVVQILSKDPAKWSDREMQLLTEYMLRHPEDVNANDILAYQKELVFRNASIVFTKEELDTLDSILKKYRASRGEFDLEKFKSELAQNGFSQRQIDILSVVANRESINARNLGISDVWAKEVAYQKSVDRSQRIRPDFEELGQLRMDSSDRSGTGLADQRMETPEEKNQRLLEQQEKAFNRAQTRIDTFDSNRPGLIKAIAWEIGANSEQYSRLSEFSKEMRHENLTFENTNRVARVVSGTELDAVSHRIDDITSDISSTDKELKKVQDSLDEASRIEDIEEPPDRSAQLDVEKKIGNLKSKLDGLSAKQSELKQSLEEMNSNEIGKAKGEITRTISSEAAEINSERIKADIEADAKLGQDGDYLSFSLSQDQLENYLSNRMEDVIADRLQWLLDHSYENV